MKKTAVIFVLITLAAAVLLGAAGASAISNAYNIATEEVENIAGAVLAEYPQAEEVFVKASLDEENSTLAEGRSIMSRYGYGGALAADTEMKRSIRGYIIMLSLFMAAVIYGFKPVLPGLSGETDKPPAMRVRVEGYTKKFPKLIE